MNWKKHWVLWLVSTLIIAYTVVVGLKNGNFLEDDYAILVILALTLLVLIFYAFFTFKLWEVQDRQSFPSVSCWLEYLPRARDTRFKIVNTSRNNVVAHVNLNAKVYNQTADFSDHYNGKRSWHLTPGELVDGHFSIDDPLSKVGQTFQQMKMARQSSNHNIQLTLEIEVKYSVLKGNKPVEPLYENPIKKYYFNFDVEDWVYDV